MAPVLAMTQVLAMAQVLTKLTQALLSPAELVQVFGEVRFQNFSYTCDFLFCFFKLF